MDECRAICVWLALCGLLSGCTTTRQYSLPCGDGEVRFSFSKKWHPEKGAPRSYEARSMTYSFCPPDMPGNSALSLTVLPRELPGKVDFVSRMQEQHALAEKELSYLRSNRWKEAGLALDYIYTRKDGVNVYKWAVLSNGAHIICFLTTRHCIIEVNYWGRVKELADYEGDVNRLIESITLD